MDILRTYGKDGFFYTQKGLLEEAVSLITYEYRTTEDPAVRANIARLETGYYGYSEDNGCTSHTDGQVLWNPEAR